MNPGEGRIERARDVRRTNQVRDGGRNRGACMVNDRENTGEPSFPRHACCDRPPSARLRPSRRQLGRSPPSLVGRQGSSKSFRRSSEVVGKSGRSSAIVDGFW